MLPIPPSEKDTSMRHPIMLIVFALSLAATGPAAPGDTSDATRAPKILASAREMMEQARYCALITVDDASQPQARTVDPLPADDGLEVWVLTNRSSRKVAQLRHNPRATLYYFTPVSPGYVTLLGEATVIESAADKASAWRPAWGEARRKQLAREDFVLIHFRPRRLEIVSYVHALTNDAKTMLPVILDLP
jgi:general stress protein 26